MNSKYISVLITVLLSTHVVAGNDIMIRTIKESRVAKRAQDIESMIKRHYYIQTSMTVGTAVVQLMQIYRLGKAIFGKSSQSDAPDASTSSPAELGKDVVPKEEQDNIVVQLAKQLGSGIKNLFFTKKGLWKLVQGFGEVGSLLMMQLMMEKLITRHWHPDTLHWFVYAQVPYRRTARLIDEFIDKLQDPTLPAEQHAFYHQSLINACNQLVEYAERICAYMEYKSNKLSGTQKMVGLSTGRYLFNRANDWAAEIRTYFADDKPHYLKINNNIAMFISELSRQLEHFASIEDETNEERLRVKYAHHF